MVNLSFQTERGVIEMDIFLEDLEILLYKKVIENLEKKTEVDLNFFVCVFLHLFFVHIYKIKS